MRNIRNFVIIAHIDHGKSTLADRFLEKTGTIAVRQMKTQYLDQLELERERGITIKMAPVRMVYRPKSTNNESSPNTPTCNAKRIALADGRIRKFETDLLPRPRSVAGGFGRMPLELSATEHGVRPNAEPLGDAGGFDDEFILNLIDTPGHSDFAYEVSRALAAVEGAILLVDVTQGIQAQTISNLRTAREAGLKIIAVVNKIDVFKKEEERIHEVVKEVSKITEISEDKILKTSGKTGDGVAELLEEVVKKIPPPSQKNVDGTQKGAEKIQRNSALSQRESTINARALIFDSFYDEHKGVVALVRVFEGKIKASDELKLMFTNSFCVAKEVGHCVPELQKAPILETGEIGYVATGIRDPNKIKIGDTITIKNKQQKENYTALPGYKEPNPTVFVSFYPEQSEKYENLKLGLEKLKLNDSSIFVLPSHNELLGRGFLIGFLGKLHYEITAERLKREFNVPVVNTFPSVKYKVKLSNVSEKANSENKRGGLITISKPEDLPANYEEIWEPIVEISIFVPAEYVNVIFSIQNQYRIKNIQASTVESRVEIKAKMPMAELISDFDDKLKSLSSGLASLSYRHFGYEKANVLRVDILVVGKKVTGLSRFLSQDKVEKESRKIVQKLKKVLPRQQFVQSVQAAVGSRIIARENIPALRKNVTGHLYGGDITRKMKLWEKQKKGKKKLKEMGNIKIVPEVFRELLKKD